MHLDAGHGRCAGQLAASLLGFDCRCPSFVDCTLNASVLAISARLQVATVEAAAMASSFHPLAYEAAEALDRGVATSS